MSFLDNLENNLKALESREEKDPEALRAERAKREAEKEAALKAAPVADALRNGPYVGALLTACRTLGHARRVMVRPVWLGTVLRLEAGERKLELHPGADGVTAVFFEGGAESRREAVDLSGDAGVLAARWLGE